MKKVYFRNEPNEAVEEDHENDEKEEVGFLSKFKALLSPLLSKEAKDDDLRE